MREPGASGKPNLVHNGGKARRSGVGLDECCLRAFIEQYQNTQMPPIRNARFLAFPFIAQVKWRREFGVRGHVQDDPILHERGIEVQENVILLRIDLPDLIGEGRRRIGEDLSQRHRANLRDSRLRFIKDAVLEQCEMSTRQNRRGTRRARAFRCMGKRARKIRIFPGFDAARWQTASGKDCPCLFPQCAKPRHGVSLVSSHAVKETVE